MWKHYALIALRNMRRQYGYSLINIIGLSTGLAVCLLIWMYVQDERGYDQHHPDGDRIFRLVTYWQQNGAWIGTAQSSYRMRPELEAADFPQVEAMARFDPSFVRLEYEGNTYEEGQVAMMDPEALDIFHIPLRSGDPAKVLADPFTAIMSTDMARRYFGDDDPVGKVLRVNDMADLVITGVMDPMPEKSHFHFDMLVSLKTGPVIYPDIVLNNLGEMSQVTYLKLKRPEDKEALEAQFPAFAERLLGEEAPGMIRFELQPIHDIHLHSQLQGEIEPNGNIRYLYIFGTVALFILLIACINYMNLATARAGRRMREVGLRKVVGARRTQLIGQFLAESVVISLFATLLALVWADLFLPMFNQLAGKELAFSHLPGGAWLTLLGFGLLVGFLAGSYPAFVLSGFRPVQILRGRGHDLQLGGLGLRRGLVVVQFAISIILIISTLTVSSQLNYLRNKDLGLNTEQLVIMPLPTDSAARDYPGLKNRLLADPNIVSVTASNKRLTRRLSSILGHEVQGVTLNQESGAIRTVTVDHDFFRTMDVDMVAGRDFSRGYGTDGTSAFIFNETAIRLMGLTPEEALGRQVETSTLSAQKAWIPRKGQIVGVAKDFHFESLENKIVPVAYHISEDWLHWMTVRVRGQDIPGTLDKIEAQWSALAGEATFDPHFLDEDLDALYQEQERLMRISTIFALIAIAIACLGILGLAAFMAQQRTRELGIRKVLGASTFSLMRLLTQDFLWLVLVAAGVAAPIGGWLMYQWLMDFPYRIDLQPLTFVLATALALLIALSTVAGLAWRAAHLNPVEAIRHE